MESKDLKIAAGNLIVESELTKNSKKQLLNFIQHEACDHQIMALMLDGEITKLDEQSKEIVEERFENKFGDLNEGVSFKSIFGIIFFGGLWAAWRMVKAHGDERFNNKYNSEQLLEVSVRALQGKMGKVLKYGFAAIAGGMLGIGAPLSMAIYYLYRRYNDVCIKKCSSTGDTKTCYSKCAIDVATKIISNLKSELGKCSKTKDPEKCKNKIIKEIKKWENKIQKLRMNP